MFNHYKWGANPDGTIFSGRYRLKSHRCTRAELGLDQEAEKTTSSLFPLEASYVRDIKFYQKKFVCPDLDDLQIFGTFSSQETQIFNV